MLEVVSNSVVWVPSQEDVSFSLLLVNQCIGDHSRWTFVVRYSESIPWSLSRVGGSKCSRHAACLYVT